MQTGERCWSILSNSPTFLLKSILNSNIMIIKKIYVNSWYMAMISAITLTYIATLFLLDMIPTHYPWNTLNAVKMANDSYVHEIINQEPGITNCINRGIDYGRT